MASRVASALETRLSLPRDFVLEVMERIGELVPECERLDEDFIDHAKFRREQDEQLLLWLNQ